MTVKTQKPKKTKTKVKQTMAERYMKAYKALYKKLPDSIKLRVLQLKKDPSSTDYHANKFIKDVIALAESNAKIK
jgi:hypothetical protein